MTRLPITAVLGTIDEADNLRRVLPELRDVVREIVIVDDASRDDTVQVARGYGAIVVERSRRLGIGSAIHRGVTAATQPYVVTMDADGSHPPSVLGQAMTLLEGGADVVKFSRFCRGASAALGPGRRLLLRAYGALFCAVCSVRLTDPTNGFLIARRSCFSPSSRFQMDPGEGWVAEFLAHNRGRRVVEMAYRHLPRRTGHSRFGFRREASRALRSLWLGLGRAEPPALGRS